MNNDLNVVMVYAIDPNHLKMGGGIRYATNLIKSLKEHDVKIILMGVDFSSPKSSIQLDVDKFIPVVKKTDTWWKYYIHLYIKCISLRLPNKSVIHIHRTYYSIPFIIFNKKNPIICTLHMKPLEFVKIEYEGWYQLINIFFKNINKFCIKHIDSLIAVSDEVRDAYVKEYPEYQDKFILIPGSGVDTSVFKPMDKIEARKKVGLPQEKRIILFVGRIESIKNLTLVIDAFPLIKEKIKNAYLVIVGDGREKNSISQKVNKMNLNNDILFFEEANPSIMPLIYSSADVLVVASLSEASPTVIREAMACGVPTVSTNVGDARNIITAEEYGLIVEKPNKDKFSEAAIQILDYLDNNQEVARSKCRDKAINNFSFDKIANRYASVYRMLLLNGQE